MAEKDATQEGVSEEVKDLENEKKDGDTKLEAEGVKTTAELEAEERAKSPIERNNAERERIAASLDTVDETGVSPRETYVGITDQQPKPDKPDKDEEDTSEGADELAEAGKETRKLVVDGEEREVPLSDVVDAGIRTLQKEAAADKRLADATALLKEAKSLKEAQLPTKKKVDAEDEDEDTIVDAVLSSDRIKELTQAIQYGEDEEAAKAIQEIINMGRGQGAAIPTTEELVKQIKEKLATESRQEISDRFSSPEKEGGFGDLLANPYLSTIVVKRVDDMLISGSPNTWDTYDKAGKEIRERRDIIMAAIAGQAVDPTKKDDLKNKRDKKKTIDNIEGVDLKTPLPVSEPKAESPSDIIQNMRKARGQPT